MKEGTKEGIEMDGGTEEERKEGRGEGGRKGVKEEGSREVKKEGRNEGRMELYVRRLCGQETAVKHHSSAEHCANIYLSPTDTRLFK